MMKIKKSAHINDECVACGVCVKLCPVDAITIFKGIHAAVDTDKCIGCGKCMKGCPADVIELREKERRIK